jgi:uncharacterized membrane protein
MLGALILHWLIWNFKLHISMKTNINPDSAQAILIALSASMFTFIVFVFSIMLLSVQLASAQLTPRIIAFFYRNRVLRFSLTVFVFTFTFTLAVIFRLGYSVNQISLWIAIYSSLACIGIFLYMIDHVGKSLRPISLLSLIGNKGQEVIMDVYPQLNATHEDLALRSHLAEHDSARIIVSNRSGVVLAFDVTGLAKLAMRYNCLIELVPQVGDFIAREEPLFRVYNGGEALSDQKLYHVVAIGSERTMEQDPGFAFRIIADIAIKALSPSINDPTTAVIALDQIHRLLRTVAKRQLNSGMVNDNSGQLRLIYRTPQWENFISLAITEIRIYGKDSIQVVRRLRSMLEDLIKVVPEHRVESLQAELEVLIREVERNFQDPKDRIHAALADSLGIGGKR